MGLSHEDPEAVGMGIYFISLLIPPKCEEDSALRHPKMNLLHWNAEGHVQPPPDTVVR